MAKRLTSLSFSPMTGGINRFVDEARDDQCIEALDVWEHGGDLCRRPAFQSISTGAPYLFPEGMSLVKGERLVDHVFSTSLTGSFTIDNTYGGLAFRLWVGCIEPFDGIDWRNVTTTPLATNATGNARLVPKWRDTDANLTVIYGAVDTTRKLLLQGTSPTEQCVQPLWKNGRIGWNRQALTDQGWALSTLDGVDRYWVALDLSIAPALPGEPPPAAIAFPFSSGSITMGARGIRCFLLNPINGLMPAHTKGSARVVVVGSDFARKRGNCLGGGLGYIRNYAVETEIARIVEDEGSGSSGATSGDVWGGGNWADGTASAITKHRRDYDWLANLAPPGIDVGQFDGSPVLNATAVAGSTALIVNFTAGWEGPFNINFENHRLRCVSGVGTPLGEEREIWRCNPTTIEVRDAFSVAPAATQIFEIRKPPSFVRTREGKRDYEIGSNTAHRLDLLFTQQYQNALATADNATYVNFEIFKESFWTLNPSVRWCCAFDSVTGQLIMTNGENGLLSFDGLRTRRLEALWDPTEGVLGSAIVRLWRGIVQDLVTQHNDPNLLNGSDLKHSPPNGKYVVDFSGRLVVACIRERAQSVTWSAPGGLNNIWPLTYEALVRDSDNGPITGMATLGSYLAVFTKTSIHLGSQPNERGEIYFKPASQGIGFTSHAAVARIAINGQDALIGPSVDGIYIFNGGEPIAVLDDWRRVLKKGVSKGKLERAVGAALHTENLYFLAVAESGSEVLDRIIVVDYSRAPQAQVWVWSAPVYDAVTAIAREVRANGDERILFGMKSGHVCELANAEYDGWGGLFQAHARSKPIKIEGGRAAFSRLLLKLKPLGDKKIGIYTYINRSDLARTNTSLDLPAVADAAIYGTDNYGDADANYWPPSMRTYPLNMPSGLVGEEISLEIYGNNQWRFGGGEVLIAPKGQKSQ